MMPGIPRLASALGFFAAQAARGVWGLREGRVGGWGVRDHTNQDSVSDASWAIGKGGDHTNQVSVGDTSWGIGGVRIINELLYWL